MDLEKRIEFLEKKVAALEMRAQEQPNSSFADYLLQCTLNYQAQMSKTNLRYLQQQNQYDEV